MAKSAKRMKRIKRIVRKNRTLKMKTKQSARKRYKVTGSGKVKCPCAYRSHFMSHRSRSRKNRLRRGRILSAANIRLVRRCLPNSF